ncbi:LacI family DNA-binding transcriptional regulator [Larsenimonas rhizosphaerae]|uniref:Substrate-binding domain-containing protein n=1 Tax=Larsenimonas rhizosphaerae TaxID=2944682 RepID=A0AA42CW06_9GAMM|nr:substrate-binding domain-containing protein [Larsenimonas rhizosphaerae]MCM2131215.1 substrate-binding domain-containing protein [Larsenimonas rhizosphaerae]MCX2525426.1 substrate-binding domain-containing protein [Larsenimonas rhizosphaerae]
MPRPPARPRLTILDVARDAGVSKTSVSRYFGPERSLLSESMRTRIEASISRLGFYPDRIASSLRGRRTGLIGMLVADMRNPFTVAMIHGAEQACRARGYSLVVCNTDSDDLLEQRHLDVLQGYNVEGLVVNTRGHSVAPLVARFEAGLPMVMVDRHLPGLACDMVGLDNAQAMHLAMTHLAEQGYRKVLMVTPPIPGISSREERTACFESEALLSGLESELFEVDLDNEPARLGERLAGWLDEAPACRGAILTGNGVVNLAVCQALHQLMPAPLERTGLLGIDELEWCALVGPGISTVEQPVGAMGEEAIIRLLTRIEGDAEAPVHRTFEATLNVRGSTARVD